LVIIVLHAVGHGAALAGLAILADRWARGRRWPIEPGLWLLAALGSVAVARVVLGLVPRDVFHQDEVVLAALTSCLLVVPALARETSPVWKRTFCLLAMALAAPLLAAVGEMAWGPAGGALMAVGRQAALWRLPVCLLVLAVAVVVDWRRSEFRTWIHWVGVLDLLWILALPDVRLQF